MAKLEFVNGICRVAQPTREQRARIAERAKKWREANPAPASSATAATLTPAMIAHGAAGVARALAGTGGASAATIEQRTKICGGCDKAVLRLGVLQQCSICRCATWAKIRNAGESCPLNKWTAQPHDSDGETHASPIINPSPGH